MLWSAIGNAFKGVAHGFSDQVTGTVGLITHPAQIVSSVRDAYNQGGLWLAINQFNPVYHLLTNVSNGIDALQNGCITGAFEAFTNAGFDAASTLALGYGAARVTRVNEAAPSVDFGLSDRGIRPAAGTRIKPTGIPSTWRVRGTKSKGGVLYYDPKSVKQGNAVRVMQGNRNSPYPNSQVPYVRWQLNGQPLDRYGNVLPNAKVPEAHIPLNDFQFNPEVFGK